MYSVMIVDDEKAIREGLALTTDFESYGFCVCATARNGAEALEKTESLHPDVVLLDVCMPILDGIGYMKELAENKGGGEIPCVVMLSGYSDFEYARAAVRYGAKAYLTKPLEEEELGRVLGELKEELDSRALRRDGERQSRFTAQVQRMYHGGEEGRKDCRDFFILHCVVLGADWQKEIYHRVRGWLEERIPGGASALIRSRGSIFSYLCPKRILSGYQYSITLLGRSFIYGLKQEGIEAAVLLDETIFEKEEGSFRNDYDTHLYRMLTEVFWGEQRLLQEKGLPNKRLEGHGGWDGGLDTLKKALQQRDGERVKEEFDHLVSRAEEERLSMILIQSLNYRIFYMLAELMKENEMERLTLEPQEWRDSSCFVCCGQWRRTLWEQISKVQLWLEQDEGRKQSGLEERVLAYMDGHFREPLLLKDVAERFFVSPAYLGRCIQKAAGISFKQYLNDRRIEEAMRLLEQTDRMIYEIADEVGFGESKYFVSRFVEKAGKTPSEYRKAVKKADSITGK